MKYLALAALLLSAFGCGAGAGDPNVGASTGPQPSSVGNLPVPSKKSNDATTPPGDSFSRSR